MNSILLMTGLLVTLALPAFAALSPQRAPGVDYKAYLPSTMQSQNDFSKQQYSKDEIVEWESLEVVQTFFEATRDERYLDDGTDFARRITWLFPDNGCFARAALVIKKAQDLKISVPNRIFVYGNLKVQTPHSPQNFVTWWYHTAPLIRVKNQLYVLDASLNHDRPLLLEEWINLQLPKQASREIRFCHSHTYDPEDSCLNPDEDPAEEGLYHIQEYLRAEWKRQIRLGRDPHSILGDNPPWKLSPLL